LAGGQALDLAQHEGNALLARQEGRELLEDAPHLAAAQSVAGGRLAGPEGGGDGRVAPRAGRGPLTGAGGLGYGVQGGRPPVRPLATQQVDAQIGGDAVQPGVETAALPEAPDDAEQADEHPCVTSRASSSSP